MYHRTISDVIASRARELEETLAEMGNTDRAATLVTRRQTAVEDLFTNWLRHHHSIAFEDEFVQAEEMQVPRGMRDGSYGIRLWLSGDPDDERCVWTVTLFKWFYLSPVLLPPPAQCIWRAKNDAGDIGRYPDLIDALLFAGTPTKPTKGESAQ